MPSREEQMKHRGVQPARGHFGGDGNRRAAKTASRNRTARSFLFSVLAVMALILFGEAENRAAVPEDSSPESVLRVLSPDYVYEQLLGTPEPPAKFVAIVMLYRDMPRPIPPKGLQSARFSTGCERRAYLGRLLRALEAARPKAVVLDMWFEPTSCSDTDSQPLWTVLDELSKQVHVVSGIGTFSPRDATSGWPAELAAAARVGGKLKPTELVAMPAVSVPHLSSEAITEGVVELNADNRKIPLSWPVYDTFASLDADGSPRRVDSLAIAAVRLIDPRNPTLRRIGALDANDRPVPSTDPHPYTTFLREEDLPIMRADQVLCASGDSAENCSTNMGAGLNIEELFAGKIVFIGSAGFGDDVHQSLIGDVPGVVLQANYVESLLQDRVYVPITFAGQIVLLGGWVGAWVWVPTLVSSRKWKLVAHAAALTLPIFFLHLYVVHYKHYIPFLGPLLVGVVVFLVSRKIDEFVVEGERER